MRIVPTSLPGVVIIEPPVFEDPRGWFMESYNHRRFQDALAAAGLPVPGPFVQDNHSCSQRHVLRGIHFQLPPGAQGKLVRTVKGRVFDVAVDLRRSSPRFGHWTGVELTDANRRQLWVPEGFGHGFLSLEDDTQVVYKTTGYWSKDHERVVAWNDPLIAIDWPLDTGVTARLVARDADAPSLHLAECFA